MITFTRQAHNQKLVQTVVTESLGKYVKYNILSFFIIKFSSTGLLKWPLGGFWRTIPQNTRNHARMCLFAVRLMENHV